MWTYKQSTGQVFHNGQEIAKGYSGHGEGLNNPDAQDQHGIGPAPEGFYNIGQAQTHPHLGPLAMALLPLSGNQMFGRSAFYIHGDNAEMNHTASDGCLIFDHMTRQFIADQVAMGDNSLQIIA
jgi:hypothetical protein